MLGHGPPYPRLDPPPLVGKERAGALEVWVYCFVIPRGVGFVNEYSIVNLLGEFPQIFEFENRMLSLSNSVRSSFAALILDGCITRRQVDATSALLAFQMSTQIPLLLAIVSGLVTSTCCLVIKLLWRLWGNLCLAHSPRRATYS